MEILFIATISVHRALGNIILPYAVMQKEGKAFFSVKDRLTVSNIKDFKGLLSPGIESLIKICEEYDENAIVKVFSKKKTNSSDFFKNVGEDMLENHIRSYVENRIVKCINIIKEHKIDLYFKDQAVNIHFEDKIEVVETPSKAVFHFNRENEGIKYFLSVKNENANIELTDKRGFVLVNSPCQLILENKLFSFTDIDGKKLLPFFTKKHVLIPKASEKKYFETFVRNSIRDYDVIPQGFEIRKADEKPNVILSMEKDLEGNAVLMLSFKYPHNTVCMANKPTNPKVILESGHESYVFTKIERDLDFEKACCLFLENNGLKNGTGPWFYVNSRMTENYEIIEWISHNKNILNEKNIEVSQAFYQDKYSTDAVELDFNVKKENDWFDLHVLVRIGEFVLPFMKFKRNIIKGIREYELPNGKITILPETWFEKYRDIFMYGKSESGTIKIRNFHANLINDEISLPDNKIHENLKMLDFKEPGDGKPQPKGLMATLRPYQFVGYNYMLQTGENKLGVCLADDMGLGKTLQTLSLLQYRVENKHNIVEKVVSNEGPKQLSLFGGNEVATIKEKQASLIVMPASLIHNWYNEIRKFTPDFKVCIYTGFNRNKDVSGFGEFDVLLTTYGTLRVDYEILRNYNFFYIILDESQVIKNYNSKTYKAVVELTSKYRLVLTGTPIENSLGDLWSQLNFLNKGLLGSYGFFKEEFITPIEKLNDEGKQQKLQKLIQPFILRRTKKEVAGDLPELTEQVIYCDLTEEQERFYESEKSKIRNSILQNIKLNGVEKSTFVVLQGLTKLRQLANHPILVDGDYRFESGKFNEIARNLENLADENHKALIFSSFVKHLELFEDYFNQMGYGYSKLTGETRNREEVVQDFQNNRDNKFFLISLKAGGVGLNLTAAEYVFMLDPWWNPAAENQAINRAHRIGQENKVFVYRFISSNTIEEKIQQLQQRKSHLAEVFVNSNNPFKDLSVDNVMELFK